MKYLKEEYWTKGYCHLCIKRYKSIYIYEKYETSEGVLMCYEVFKARTLKRKNDRISKQTEVFYAYPRDKDFPKNAHTYEKKKEAFEKFRKLKKKYFGP